MIILEKPYVSAPLVEYLEKSQIAVLRNEMSELLAKQGHKLNLVNDKEFVEQYQQTGKLYAVSAPSPYAWRPDFPGAAREAP